MILAICSCKKNNDNTPAQPEPDILTTGWTKQVIQGESFLFDVFFIQNTGFILSQKNIYRSINGGTDWTVAYTTSNNFANLGMGSASNAIFVTTAGKIISTHNGGTTFDSVAVADALLSDVFFINATTAYAAGTSLWKTTDAGYNWIKVSDFPAGSPYKTIHFINEQTGWVNDGNGSYKTINGGATWQPLPANIFRGSAIWFTDANTGYSSSSSTIGKTTDGGTTWTSIRNEPSGAGQYIDLHFIDNATGYFCYAPDIYKTTNGGANWSSVAKVGGGGIIEIHFTDATHGWACGLGGVVLKYAP
jgi:hypothetical protein